MTSLTNATFLAVASTSVTSSWGRTILRTSPGNPAPATYVYQTQRAFASIAARFGEVVERRDHGDRIQKEPLLDLFGFSDRREIELRASFQE